MAKLTITLVAAIDNILPLSFPATVKARCLAHAHPPNAD